MRTEISNLGEFGLIRHLTEGIELKNESSRYGVGDDAAVLSYPTEKQVLITTDLLMEGVHFDLIYVPLKHLGYKAAVVNFSDIYAMNGTPKQITVSLALSKRFSVEDMEELYAGIRLACEEYNVDIIGGDTSSSLTGLAISITCIGEVDKDKVVYRNGAKETDLIGVPADIPFRRSQVAYRSYPSKLLFRVPIIASPYMRHPDHRLHKLNLSLSHHFFGSLQALLRRRYGRIVCRYPSGVRGIQCGYHRR